MTFASKLIHWGLVHPCNECVKALQEITDSWVGVLKKQETKNKLIEN